MRTRKFRVVRRVAAHAVMTSRDYLRGCISGIQDHHFVGESGYHVMCAIMERDLNTSHSYSREESESSRYDCKAPSPSVSC